MPYYFPYTEKDKNKYQIRQTQGFTAKHRGRDLAPKIKVSGIHIIASCDGSIRSGNVPNAEGRYCIINDGKGVEIYTGHHATIIKKSGHVRAGDIIATFGSTGNSSGMHTHMQVKKNGRIVDPYSLNLKYFNSSTDNEMIETGYENLQIRLKTTNTSPMNHRSEPATSSPARPKKIAPSGTIYTSMKIAKGSVVTRNGVKYDQWYFINNINDAPDVWGWVSGAYITTNIGAGEDCSGVEAELEACIKRSSELVTENGTMRTDMKTLSDKYPV